MYRKGELNTFCRFCEKRFHIKPYGLKRGRGIFCSKLCQKKSMEKKVLTKCSLCAKEFFVKLSEHKKGSRQRCSLECSKIFRKIHAKKKVKKGTPSGEKHWNWQGGKTEKHIAIRSSVKYKEWRKSVFERDNYTCVLCGARNKKGSNKSVILNADHIVPLALNLDMALDITNGRTLCVECHRKTDTYGFNYIKHKIIYERNKKI